MSMLDAIRRNVIAPKIVMIATLAKDIVAMLAEVVVVVVAVAQLPTPPEVPAEVVVVVAAMWWIDPVVTWVERVASRTILINKHHIMALVRCNHHNNSKETAATWARSLPSTISCPAGALVAVAAALLRAISIGTWATEVQCPRRTICPVVAAVA